MTMNVSSRISVDIEVDSLSDRGKKRHLNEDAVFDFTTHTQAGTSAGLYMVCDGKGGQEAGDIASQMTVETMVAHMIPLISKYQAIGGRLRDEHATDVQRGIKEAVSKANEKIRSYNQEKLQNRKAETTLTMAFLQDREAIVANVGDSRAYVWHDQGLTQITNAHLLKEGWEDDKFGDGDTTGRTSASGAVGTNGQVEVDFYEYELEAGDKLLLCSDGLWQAFADEKELASFLNANRYSNDICQQLIHEANLRDGSDNISAVVISAA